MMMLVAHPDDELLWFGGLLPLYAGERNLAVQLIYAVPATPVRRLELLDGLWTCGVKAYPVFLNMPDKRSDTLEGQYKRWNRNTFYDRLTGMIRRYRPEVLVTQDYNGEYGHGAHRAVADGATRCVGHAADSSSYPASVKSFGTWQVKKLYVHLSRENMITMNWHEPLSVFGGLDGLQVCRKAMACHASQVNHGWKIEDGGECDNSLFGLVMTKVGPDLAGNDLMENIPLEESAADTENDDLA